MAPSKTWMSLVDERLDHEYLEGVEKFLDYAFSHAGGEDEIRCPCIKCCNTYSRSRELVSSHLKVYGILRNYTLWYHHGEVAGEPQTESEGEGDDETGEEGGDGYDGMQDLLMDLYPQNNSPVDEPMTPPSNQEEPEEPNNEAAEFYKLLDKYNQPLYQGSSTTKLSALVNLLHIKNTGKWSNKSFTMLLDYLRKAFLPHNSSLPNSYYEAKKTIQELGLSYRKIDACKNHCMLFWKEDIDAETCKVCGISRWKEDKRTGTTLHSAKGKKIPHKTMRYFPIKPRLQRMFMSRKTAEFFRWHNEGRVDDGVMRHPADSRAWKHFDEKNSEFAKEPRNVRLCLSSDGFQPYTNMRTSYSIWPVFLVPLNLPPWMCMKQQNVMLSMLIPGPDGPGDAIDIYLQPLVEELIELWDEGIDTYDASAKKSFKLYAALLWMVHDFPGYANLSGYSTKGRLACPVCHSETCSLWLNKGSKFCYMGHRRFLRKNHRWRKDKSKNSFNGTTENREPPTPLTGENVMQQVADLADIVLSKDASKKTKVSHDDRGDNWNKRSIFCDLPYFKTLLLRHNLDVMHIEKNICDSIIGTIMDVKGKTKDNINSRLDLELLDLKSHMHPDPVEKGGKATFRPAAYTLTPQKKNLLLMFFKYLKVADGFCSNLSRCTNMKEQKISGLKSHDCHVILNHLLPHALRGLLPENIYEPLVELSQFFCKLNSKSLSTEELKELQAQIPLTLCKLEKEFPPSFFDVMMHLPVHLADEALIGGPTIYRWMYLFERQIKCLKSLVRNMARPEASIAEGYIADEFMTLCSRYLDDVETKHNRPNRINDAPGDEKYCLSIFNCGGRPSGGRKTRDLNNLESEQAHIYVLRNCDEVQPYISEYCGSQDGSLLQPFTNTWNQKFIQWFKEKVIKMSNHRYGNLTASAQERSNSQLNRSGLVQQRVARRTLGIRPSEAAHFSRNMAIHARDMEVQEQHEDYDRAGKDGNEAAQNATQGRFSSLWHENNSESMNTEDDSSDDGDIGNDKSAGIDDTESEEVHGNHGLALASTSKNGEKRRVRGKNKCKEVADLMESQKIKVRFYNNRALSKSFARHLGRIARNPRITPMRVKAWSNITGTALKHIFDSIKDKFENVEENISIDMYKDEILEHLRKLWNNWRGDLHRKFVKPAKSMREALKSVPKDVSKDDWEWLVKEHFMSKEFLERSTRNSKNRANLKMLHTSGSKPYRQVIWDLGGKENKPPTMDKLFFETHKKGGTLVTSEASTKHADLVNIVQSNPALSNIEVIDKSDTSKRRKRVFGFGGGIKARDLRGPALSKAELVSKLQKSEEEKQVLAEKLDGVVDEVAEIKRLMSTRSLSNIPQGTHDDQAS